VSQAGFREVFLWFVCAVILGLIAIPIRIYLVWQGHVTSDVASLISGEVALPCMVLTAGALAQHVIKRINSSWQFADGILAFLSVVVLIVAAVVYLFPPEARAGSVSGLVIHSVVFLFVLVVGGSSVFRSAL
jgi:hypothetical protein